MNIHAHLVIAPSLEEAALPEIVKKPSVDVEHIVTENLGIEDARTLKERASQRAMTGDTRSFVLLVKRITPEAQNALLKLFEDPPEGAVFYLVLPSESLLLPTLHSRLIQTERAHHTPDTHAAKKFLESSYAFRLEQIASILKGENMQAANDLIYGIIACLKEGVLPAAGDYIAEIMFVERNFGITGGSKKMLLEHLALSLPLRK